MGGCVGKRLPVDTTPPARREHKLTRAALDGTDATRLDELSRLELVHWIRRHHREPLMALHIPPEARDRRRHIDGELAQRAFDRTPPRNNSNPTPLITPPIPPFALPPNALSEFAIPFQTKTCELSISPPTHAALPSTLAIGVATTDITPAMVVRSDGDAADMPPGRVCATSALVASPAADKAATVHSRSVGPTFGPTIRGSGTAGPMICGSGTVCPTVCGHDAIVDRNRAAASHNGPAAKDKVSQPVSASHCLSSSGVSLSLSTVDNATAVAATAVSSDVRPGVDGAGTAAAQDVLVLSDSVEGRSSDAVVTTSGPTYVSVEGRVSSADSEASTASVLLQGEVRATWAAVDDRRRLVASAIFREAGGAAFAPLLHTVIEYVGCVVCHDQHCIKYRMSRLSGRYDLMFAEQCFVGLSDGWHSTELDKLNGPQQAWRECRWYHASRVKRGSPRRTCRYCGLSLRHHFCNRELQIRSWPPMLDELGWIWKPEVEYCGMRCPIHSCIDCHEPFVKVERSHLCSTCLARHRRINQENPRRPNFVALHSINAYKDEIQTHVPIPTIVSVVESTTKSSPEERKIGEERASPTTSSSSHLIRDSRVDKKLALTRVHTFLANTEYRCVRCDQRFRLSHVTPALLQPDPPTKSTHPTQSTITAQNELFDPELHWRRHHRQKALCGFCM
jgi:hypothetical protein